MKRLINFSYKEAKKHFLKCNSYFNSDIPPYISFEPIITAVSKAMKGGEFNRFQDKKPSCFSGVNYSLVSNKDGKLKWRPYELMHPVIYVSLVNVICEKDHWNFIKRKFAEFKCGVVECYSDPVISMNDEKDVAAQVSVWWKKIEQRSLIYSLKFSHMLHTDVTDCYGSLYTHSISWALHGVKKAKDDTDKNALLGNKIDFHIQSSRYGQTNGISQGSVLMDFIAEIVLGFVDIEINLALKNKKDFHKKDFRILRYRDDYRIFTNSDDIAEKILKVISDELRKIGMILGASKTYSCRNVVEGSIKPDKLAGIDLQDLGKSNAKTIQKQLLRIHSFGQRFPNSGALKRQVSDFYTCLPKQPKFLDDLEVQVAIATDIAFVSPATFSAVAAILSHLISLAPNTKKRNLWKEVRDKMRRVPNNGYLEIWLQRVIKPANVGIQFSSEEAICKIVNGKKGVGLWENDWISNKELLSALDVSQIVIFPADEISEVMKEEEMLLFKRNALAY